MVNDAAKLRWADVLSGLLRGEDLSAEQTAWAMSEILSGETTAVRVAGFAIALRAKNETVDEVDGLVRAMYAHAEPLEAAGPTVDVVGTGGDLANTVNISTMAALVVAGVGVRVIKHGNRSASSACGAADLVEELGVPLDLDPRDVARLADEVGITFCFAARFHPALRHAAQARRELSVPTTFNILGPLANPARPQAQAVGVADPRMVDVVAGVLARRGTRAWVVRGDDGLDEITTATSTRVLRVCEGEVIEDRLDPTEFGIRLAPHDALRGGNAAYNADVCRALLAGEERGPVRDAVLLNAAAALAALDGQHGTLVDEVGDGLERAAHAIDSGAVADVLARWTRAARACSLGDGE